MVEHDPTAAPSDDRLDRLCSGVLRGDRRSIARAITLVESHRTSDLALGAELLRRLAESSDRRALRLGISGVPGVGKSTFLEAFGSHLIDQGLRVAVLAIDPSSTVSGGSVMGDKTRMPVLSASEHAYIRPTPGSGAAGGVSPHTREAMAVLEAAGFDAVLVETIGVGQSETAIHDLVDYLLLLVLTGAGDELQGIKRGVLELADGIAVTKADRDNQDRAETAARELRSALQILHSTRPRGAATVWTCSALEDRGIAEIWTDLREWQAEAERTGEIDRRRRAQAMLWFERRVREEAISRLLADPELRTALERERESVRSGAKSPFAAARAVFEHERRS